MRSVVAVVDLEMRATRTLPAILVIYRLGRAIAIIAVARRLPSIHAKRQTSRVHACSGMWSLSEPGAAGLVAAERAATRGRKTLLLEKNPRPGVKILMSGGTRCNLTQATDSRGIVAAYGPPGKFLHSALAALGPQDLVALVEGEGVPTKIEETGKIFPVSNDAHDVLRAFVARLERSGVRSGAGRAAGGTQSRR